MRVCVLIDLGGVLARVGGPWLGILDHAVILAGVPKHTRVAQNFVLVPSSVSAALYDHRYTCTKVSLHKHTSMRIHMCVHLYTDDCIYRRMH